jgi:hypothetical protein
MADGYDGTKCQPGTGPGACGPAGGSCTACSGTPPTCLPSGVCGCGSAPDCPLNYACINGTCSQFGCSDSFPCNGSCCASGCCALGESGGNACGSLGTQCGPSGEACLPCQTIAGCNPDGTCRCGRASDCLQGQACAPEDSGTGQVCGTSCSPTSPCNLTCCTSAGQCGDGLSPTECGSNGTCADCTSSDCTSNGPGFGAGGQACIVFAPPFDVACGCNNDGDCSAALCGGLTACNTATHQCSVPDGG